MEEKQIKWFHKDYRRIENEAFILYISDHKFVSTSPKKIPIVSIFLRKALEILSSSSHLHSQKHQEARKHQEENTINWEASMVNNHINKGSTVQGMSLCSKDASTICLPNFDISGDVERRLSTPSVISWILQIQSMANGMRIEYLSLSITRIKTWE